MNSLKNLLKIANKDYGYCDPADKKLLHSRSMRFLRELAAELGYQPGSYDVRSNKAGIAVSGEITLHTPDLYVQVCEDFFGPGMQLMIRGCKHRKDYTGHTNRFVKIVGKSPEEALEAIKTTCRFAQMEAEKIAKGNLATR